MTRPARASRQHADSRKPQYRERGASAVEYGLLVAGVAATFLIGAIGLQSVSNAIFSETVTSIEEDQTATP